MSRPQNQILLGLSLLVVSNAALAADQAAGARDAESVINFDADKAGALPASWTVGGTKPDGPLATWEVSADAAAPSAGNVLALTKINHESSSTYNICWTDTVRMGSGSIEVSYKAVGGEIDQGGGPMWRVKDANNYYICRVNPLEENFRVYFVKDGARKQLATAKVDAPAEKWHTIKVEHIGNHIVCSLDGTKYLEVDDATFADEGGVGLWTKADAATAFDNVTVRSKAAAGGSAAPAAAPATKP